MATRKPSTAPAVTGHALHIGVNFVDPAHYAGWGGTLAGARADAMALASITRAQNMHTVELLDDKATRTQLMVELRRIAEVAAAGNLVMLSFAGHGGRMPNAASGVKAGQQSATWCLHDGQCIEQELRAMLAKLPAGTRAVVLSDTCHTGTVTRSAPPATTVDPGAQRPRLMPMDISIRVYGQHRAFYDKLHKDAARLPPAATADPPTLLFAAAQENQLAYEVGQHGLFTEKLVEIWDEGRYKGSWKALEARVRQKLPPFQSPGLSMRGPAQAMLGERPFTA